MNRVNFKMWIVAGVATAALAALLLLQVGILNRSVTTNRQIFEQKVDIVLKDVAHAFRKRKADALQLPVWLHSDPRNDLDQVLNSVIDSVLGQYNLPLDCSYGIYRHMPHESGSFELVKGSVNALPLQLRQTCDKEELRHFGIVGLTCGHNYGDDNRFHLALFFNDTGDYIISQAGSGILVSFLLMALLGGLFVFLVYLLQRQKRISAIKSDFINNLTHEFKTPIFAIDLAAGILRRSDALQASGKHQEYVNIISAEAGRLRTQVDKILQMALVDSDNFRLEKKTIDLHDLIRGVAKHFELIIQQSHGRIILALHATTSVIQADDVHLRNVLNNLVDNAIKYNTRAPAIVLSTWDADGGIWFSVHDNGIGMNDAVQQQIFQRFFRAQTGDVHDVKGFGLGLSYVKQIIDAHRGTIQLESREAWGSEFKVYLPVS